MPNIIGYKKARNNCIVKILVTGLTNEGRSGLHDVGYAKHRTSACTVTEIYNMFTRAAVESVPCITNENFIYHVGAELSVSDYDTNLDATCAPGIHYFRNEAPAFFWKINTASYSGEYKRWHDNGRLQIQCNYNNGILDGSYAAWYANGTAAKTATYSAGQIVGLTTEWHSNSVKWREINYTAGQRQGQFKEWYDTAAIRTLTTYSDGRIHGNYKEWLEDGTLDTDDEYVDGEVQLELNED
jgi:hypothetical protein